MNEIAYIIETLKEIGDIGNIAVILFILYFLHEKGIIRFSKKKEKPALLEGMEDAPPWANGLIEYVNHEQTDAIREQGRQIASMAKSVDDLVVAMRDHTRLDERIEGKLNEWERYGVPRTRVP